MQILIEPFLLDMAPVRSIDRCICDGRRFCVKQPGEPVSPSWTLCWACPATNRRFGVADVGFFWDAMLIDTLGLYQFSSLNTASARDEIHRFSPPESARELILNAPLPNSKYRQPQDEIAWNGVVFASQNPGDRSIQTVASKADWWQFYEDCCRYYGSHLFVKLHPWNSGIIEQRLRIIANRHHCTIGRAGHGIQKFCDHVVVFTSTFAVDCMLHEIPVKQGAPGYFWQTGAVTYCHFNPRLPLNDTIATASCLLDFLVWRYCFSMDRTTEDWRHLLRAYAHSTDLFPLPEQMSYGSFLKRLIGSSSVTEA